MAIKLTKEETIKKINLRKEDVKNVWSDFSGSLSGTVSRVAVALDISGSMDTLFRKGVVQETMERLLPIALNFDDDGQMDVWVFNRYSKKMPTINLDNIYGYIEDNNIRANGGTSYDVVINDIVKYYVQDNPAAMPDYVIFITDGETFDKDKAEEAMINASKYPIFWQFVGIGDGPFNFLERMDTMKGRYVDNANFLKIKYLENSSDNDLYKGLLQEYPSWLKDEKVKKLIEEGATAKTVTPEEPKQRKKLFGIF